MNLKQQVLEQSDFIRTFPVAQVKQICREFEYQDIAEVRPFTSRITEWLSPVVDLSGFDYLYPVAGITEGLNYWSQQETRTIARPKHEYMWLTEQETGEVRYISVPDYATGNNRSVPVDMPVVLDLAYIGSCSDSVRITVPDTVEKVFFSLSKSFGVRNYRIGYYWSRTADFQLERLIGNAKYYNYYAMALGEELISKIKPTAINTWLRPYQDKICQELNLTPSDAVWLATTDDPDYNKFNKGKLNRINLTELIRQEYENGTK